MKNNKPQSTITFLFKKCLLFLFLFCTFFSHLFAQKNNDSLKKVEIDTNAIYTQSGHIVANTRAGNKAPFAFVNIGAKELQSQNLGQDFTYLIGNTPSVITTSDAGTGIGYTGIRIRGSDATRINVTINGIPINDAESHGVYWVNMPDLASSTSSVQIQRGVGSTTNGNGAFGASISILNTEIDTNKNLELNQSFGSFNTLKNTLKFGTGKIGNFNFSGRLSRIVSDGYIDRASSNLQAFQFNLNYAKNNWLINAVSFGGKEKTYQSWYGTPISRFNGNVAEMNAYIARNYLTTEDAQNLLNSGRTYNYYTYPNQTDNYWQNHYQLHISKKIGSYITLNNSSFLTKGKGYFEEYKTDQKYSRYGVANYTTNNDTISSTDLVRRRWLDNYYYGNFASLDYKKNKLNLNTAIGYTLYNGQHFGEVIWAKVAEPFGLNKKYYESKSLKQEWNGNIKADYKLIRKLTLTAEFQIRKINYSGKGNDNDLKPIDFNQNFTFINPKIGFMYNYSVKKAVYASYSISHREPVRTDIIDNAKAAIPKPEQLKDLEIGYIYKNRNAYFQLNGYYMNYTNQLVLTGELNDVGSSIRKNVNKSSRLGIELMGSKYLFNKKIELEGNITLSSNKIAQFNDVFYNYDSSSVITKEYTQTDISFSPNVIGYIGITDKHIKHSTLAINCKYLGKQYLDNTQNNNAKLSSYYTLNFNGSRTFFIKGLKTIRTKLMVNNILAANYANNGYAYKYISGGETITETFYYPQSFTNFMLGLDLIF